MKPGPGGCGVHEIENYSGLKLGVTWAGHASGAHVLQWTDNGAGDRRWILAAS